MTVGIVGMGLMGYTFAKTLFKYEIAKKIYGYDLNYINTTEDFPQLNVCQNIKELIKNSDLILFALPVQTIKDFLQNTVLPENKYYMDFGSVKEEIENTIPKNIRKNYLSLHPMCGSEKSGVGTYVENMYEGKTLIVCNNELNNEITNKLLENIFRTIGMRIVYMTSKEHDKHAAYISHLPHVLSYALTNTVLSHEDKDSIIKLKAGGFDSVARISKSNSKMWADIFVQNKQNILNSIKDYKKQIEKIEEILTNENEEDIKKWIEKAKNLKDI